MQEENRFIEGIFRRRERGFGFVIVEDQEDDIYIAKEDSKDAFSGDRVLVKLKKKSNKTFKRAHYALFFVMGDIYE